MTKTTLPAVVGTTGVAKPERKPIDPAVQAKIEEIMARTEARAKADAATTAEVREFRPLPKVTPAETTAKITRLTGYPQLQQEQLAVMPSVARLMNMLSYMRPAGSIAEEDFIQRFIAPVATADSYENYWVCIKNPDGSDPTILWSSHTDTVHRNGGRQTPTLENGMAYVDKSSCLGADDTSGIWLMLEMILAKVPGRYVFHREEEVGGHGSTWVNRNCVDTLKKWGLKAAIAFDRKGYDSVITHQFGSRCCSDTFAKSLAKIMGGVFQPDDGGVFTDTANYTDNVGECTNLSVGYHMAHGPNECQDVSFLVQMRDVLTNADWSQLEFERKPGDLDPDDNWQNSRWSNYSGYGYGGTRSTHTKYTDTKFRGGAWGDDEDDATTPARVVNGSSLSSDPTLEFDELRDYVIENPSLVAAFLHQQGVDPDEIEEFYFADDSAPERGS